MERLATGNQCRRATLLARFGETYTGNCNGCDVCLGGAAERREQVDVTAEARLVLQVLTDVRAATGRVVIGCVRGNAKVGIFLAFSFLETLVSLLFIVSFNHQRVCFSLSRF